ncbi:hypothetical protein CYMTET_9215 [Cymbomonas tetramitiformis]|uniref:Uncharacterized protein n=1 Tax=Cymbomonas tetramitiformis TaxID=36881 RepID=A0AAE0GRR4_9CHLO|nr:hypothetical protein CYMTET_9215 [Cymbomonas tetramitiformis]
MPKAGVTIVQGDYGQPTEKRGGDWPLGASLWEELRPHATEHRRKVHAWARVAQDMQAHLPGGLPVASLSGASGGGSRGGGLLSEARAEEIVAAAVVKAMGLHHDRRERDPPAVDLARVKHRFGRNLALLVKAWSNFEQVVARLLECGRRQCGLEDLPEDESVTKHLYAYVELEVGQLAAMQKELDGVPGVEKVVCDEAWVMQAARSRRRRKGQEKEPKAGGSDDEEAEREVARKRFGKLRAARRRSSVEHWTGPCRSRTARNRHVSERDLSSVPVCPARAPLQGPDVPIRCPHDGFDEGGAWRLDPKRGLVVDEAKHCRSLEEWDEAFTLLMCAVPTKALDLLAVFRNWMRVMALEFTWDLPRKLYKHLVARMTWDAYTSFELTSYTALWELYKREKGIWEKGARGRGSGGWVGGQGGVASKRLRTGTTETA